jgi:hypothetical protein
MAVDYERIRRGWEKITPGADFTKEIEFRQKKGEKGIKYAQEKGIIIVDKDKEPKGVFVGLSDITGVSLQNFPNEGSCETFAMSEETDLNDIYFQMEQILGSYAAKQQLGGIKNGPVVAVAGEKSDDIKTALFAFVAEHKIKLIFG